MFGKKRLIILIGLGVISFGGSFLVSAWLAGSSQPPKAKADQQPDQSNVLVRNLARSGLGDMKPREKLLEEMIKSVRHKGDLLRDKEQKLKEEEQRIRMARQELEKQTDELEGLRTRLTAPLASLRRVQADIKRNQIEMKQQEIKNLKSIAAKFEKSQPEDVANTLTNWCADGRYEDAVKILYLMSDRSFGKVLNSLKDAKMAAKLVEQMKWVKQDAVTQEGP